MIRVPKIQCQINLGRNSDISPNLIKKTVRKVLTLLKIKKAEISIAFVDCGEIKKLNKIYRGENSATDVLSFSYYYKKDYLSGEIIISWPQIEENARKEKISSFFEMNKILVHSLLHLLGYDHYGKEDTVLMRKKEQEILSKLN